MRKEHAPGRNARGGNGMSYDDTTNQEMKRCAKCHRSIALRFETYLEQHCRRGTFHRVGELLEEEKALYCRFPFHMFCAQEALHETLETL